MKIQEKLVLAFTAISITSVCAAALVFYLHAKNSATTQILHHLESVAAIQKNRVQSLIEESFEKLLLVTSRTQLRVSLENFATDPVAEHCDKMNIILRDAVSAIDEFREISILDLSGVCTNRNSSPLTKGLIFTHLPVPLARQTGKH
jgi:hypothetical protein